jgi:membrane-associated PAP2 superfamily phosphatase
VSDLDLWAASIFYHAGEVDPWPDAQLPLWSFLYIASPLLAGFVMLGGILVLIAGAVWPASRRLRCYAILLIASTILGPGLIVNGLFKDNWGRPRPHQLEQFGGSRAYVPPLAMSDHGEGKSFPCGHSSVGYMLGAFFMIWLRRRPRLAWAALAGAVALGTLLGIGRMAAGDHFLSDVIWSAVIAYAIPWVLYYFVLRIPEREEAESLAPSSGAIDLRRPRLAIGLYGLLTALLVVGVLMATPLKNVQTLVVDRGEMDPPPRLLRLIADDAYVILFASGGDDPLVKIRLEARGFGLPWSRVEPELSRDGRVLTYRLTHQGLFTERDTKLAVGVAVDQWDRVEVALDAGDIRLHRPDGHFPEVDLRTDAGEVIGSGP